LRRFFLKRLGLAVVTLVLVSIVLFAVAQILPGDVGRAILGPYATEEQVAALNHTLGVDRPLPVRYGDWIGGFVTGDWGDSVLLKTPIRPLVFDRFWNSLQLALVAIVVIVPLSIGLGVLAALREGGLLDRATSIAGLSLLAIPEFVSGTILLVLFAVALRWFPVSAQFSPGAGPIDRLHHLFLPSLPLMFVLFGYIARMARAGTLDALKSQYVRTAILKGLPRRRIVVRHVLRNSLLPTITVVGVQIGWLVGGLVVIETLFNYPGIGSLMLDAAKGHDVPVLEATVLVVALIYMLLNLTADLLYGVLNPRIRHAR
jgi:peptide/nickel transport system permease protein